MNYLLDEAKEHLRQLPPHVATRKSVTLMKELVVEIERLRTIVYGAFAHSYGPYSDTELLRRVVAILKTVNKAANVAKEQ